MGARQISTVMAAINVTDRRQELTKIAEESAGAAMEAQEVWAQSLEAKLQELSNAGAMFWQTFISSESYHEFLEFLTSVINGATQLVEVFGSIPVTVFAVSSAYTVLNSQMRENVNAVIGGLIPSYGSLITKMNQKTDALKTSIAVDKQTIEMLKEKIARNQELGYGTTKLSEGLKVKTNAVRSSTVALIANKAATIALQAAMSMGLSLAISAIVTGLTNMISKMKDSSKAAAELAKETKEAYNELRSGLESNADGNALIKEYEDLTAQIEDLSKKIKNSETPAEELKTLSEQLATAQDGLVTVQEKLIELYPQASKSIDDQGKLIFGQIQDYKDLTKAEEEHYKQKLQYLAMEASVNKSNVEAQIKDNKEKLEKLQWKFSEHQNSQSQYEYGSSWHKEFGEMAAEVAKEMTALSEDTFELEQLLDTYDAVIKQANNSQYELIVSTNNLTDAQDDLTNSTNDLSDSQKNTKKSAEELAAENKEAAETYLEVTENIQKVQEWLEKIESGKFDFSDAQSMLGVLDGFTGDITNIDDVYANLKNQLQDLVQAQGEAYAEMRYQDEEFWSQKYKGSDDWVNYVAAAEQDIISIVSNSLGVQGQDFINYIDDMGGFRDVDLSNVKNLAEAKGAVEGSLVEQLKQMWAEYYKAQSAIISDAVRQDVLKNSPNASIGKVMAMEQAAMAELNKQNEIITNLLNNVNTNVKPTYSGGAGQTYLNRNPSSSSSSSSSSKSNEVADLDLQIDRYHDLEREITRVNNALTANKAAQQHATPTEKVKLMREELKLYQELQKAQSNLMTEQKKELAELRKTLTQNGFTFNSDGTISNYQRHLQQLQNAANSLAGDAKTNKIEAVKGIKEIADAYEQLINETIPSTQNAYEELTNTIRETQKQQLEYIADIQSQITDALKEELQKRNDAVKSALEKEKELYDKQYDEDNWNDEFNKEKRKLAEIQAQIDAMSRDFSEAGRLKLEQLMEEYREQQEVIDKMLQDKMHEEGSSRYDEAIEELDKELEDLLTPESLASMVSEALEKGFISLNGEVIKTENLLTEMLKNSGDLFLATGQLIQSELIDGLKVAQSLMSDIASLNSSYLGSARSMAMDASTYALTPNVNTRSIDTRGMTTTTPSVTVSFDQLLNVEGNLDTSLMLDLETKLRQAMDEVTRSISQALTYR